MYHIINQYSENIYQERESNISEYRLRNIKQNVIHSITGCHHMRNSSLDYYRLEVLPTPLKKKINKQYFTFFTKNLLKF